MQTSRQKLSEWSNVEFQKHNLIDYIIWNQIMKILTYKVHSILKAIMDDEGVNW